VSGDIFDNFKDSLPPLCTPRNTQTKLRLN